jgi:hypothetical protein
MSDANDFEFRDGDAVIGEQLLRQRLVPRQQESPRVAARVGQLEQLEVRDDVLVKDRDVIEPFEQVEGDVRLPLGREPADFSQVVVDAECLHLVAEAGQGRDDVVLRPPRSRHDVGALLDLVRRNQVAVNEREHPQFCAHSATLCLPLWR